MKRNIIHLTGIALCAIGLFSGCNEDLPSYTSLTVDAETLTITQLYTLMHQSKNKLILYYQLQGNNKTDLFCG